MWKVLVALLILGVGAAALWVNAGQAEGPTIAITGPDVIGQTGEVAVNVTAPGGELTGLTVTLVQGESTTALLSSTAQGTTEGDDFKATIPVGKRVFPDLKAGEARVEPRETFYHEELGQFLLPYDVVRAAPSPDDVLLSFLQSTYEAAANSAHWDRAALECPYGVPRVPRSTN